MVGEKCIPAVNENCVDPSRISNITIRSRSRNPKSVLEPGNCGICGNCENCALSNMKLIMSKEEMYHAMKTVKFFKDSGLLLKCVTKATKNKTKEQRGRFLSLLLATLLSY